MNYPNFRGSDDPGGAASGSERGVVAPGGHSALAFYAARPAAAARPGVARPEAAAQTLTAMGNAARWIRSAPMDRRDAAFERIAPMLSAFLPVELVERLRRAPKDDRSLDAFIGQIGESLRRQVQAGQASGWPGSRASHHNANRPEGR